jgi:hypothetical protein
MQRFASVPKPFLGLLALTVSVLFVHVLLFSWSLIGLLWPALVTSLSLSALYGSKRAAMALKYVLYFLSVSTVLIVVAGRSSSEWDVVRLLGVGVLLFVTARYIGRSRAVAQFYASDAAHAG